MSLVVKVESADVLTQVLETLGIQGRVFCRSEFSSPWSLAFPPSGFAHFHVLEQGSGWIRLEGESAAIPLVSGDLVIVPHGGGHVLFDSPETQPVPLERVFCRSEQGYPLMRHGGGGAESHFTCGSFQFQSPAESPLLSLLPPLIHIRGAAEEWLASILQLLVYEARHGGPGAKAMISRLTDLIFVQAVRIWMESKPSDQAGWLGALRDPQIGTALGLIHRAPDRAWSVSALAREVAMSRSPFAARFTALVGEPPLAYLTRWRMHLAQSLLQSDSLSVSEVAGRVGYESAAAFSKAFKRRFGQAPGAYRGRNGRAAAPEPVRQ
jgi:AraC-like DNA-binding protein